MYILLAEIKKTAAFFEALTSVNWTESEYNKVLTALSDRGGYVANFNKTVHKLVNKKKIHTSPIYVYEGGEDKNLDTWCLIYADTYKLPDGTLWVKESDIEL